MKTIGMIILAAGMVFLPHPLRAQTAVGSFNNDIAPVQSAQSDSVVSAVAENQSLPLLTPDQIPQIPRFGTFWVVSGEQFPVPYPFLPYNPGTPVYQIADGQFLVDETGGQVPVMTHRFGLRARTAGGTAASALAAQADAVFNLITQIQTAAANQQARTMARAMDMNIPSPGGDGSGNGGDDSLSMFSSNYAFPTNGLWLEITGVSNGAAWFNLHNATNQVYAITSKTNLPLAGWNIEQEVWPTNSAVMPFTVPVLGRTSMLFIRALDWTGVTENGNTTPDWWFWEYFGTTASSDTNLDSQGNTLLYDYQNGCDPNIINFTLSYTNQYATASGAPMQVNVTAGMPNYVAVILDSTNFTEATWNAYTSSNIIINLGTTQGWHDVWVGLRGLPPDATQTWQREHLNLALPPLLVITNPVANVVSQPIIQIYGYCQESLASICYDISNTVGIVTNQPSEITDQFYDTNACGFTTNYFECLDVPLTNGLNTITIHATDLAGDVTTTNFNFTLDYSSKTNPPVVQVTWPQAGTQISGSNFTCRGWVDDPTAKITCQSVPPVTFTNQSILTNGSGGYITNAYICTNTYSGAVERNGNFWLENLPINAGTNAFTITVRDAAGNTSVTNVSIVQSTLTLTVNQVTPDSQLWQATVNLTGTISDSTYAVWVNGVKGHNNGNGTWSANNVPVNNGGTASFTATAYAPTEQQPDGSFGN